MDEYNLIYDNFIYANDQSVGVTFVLNLNEFKYGSDDYRALYCQNEKATIHNSIYLN